MAVPGSGQLSLYGIANEIDDDNYNATSWQGQISLQHFGSGGEATINTNSSSYPNTAAPHTMGEWYSYDHDAAAAWNNNTDWYSATTHTFWNTYEKFRIDFGYNPSYSGSGTVNDVESWQADSDIISSASFTPSTSTTTPGYITCDGSNDCVNSWNEGAIQNPMDLAGGGGTTIMIWFRKHTAHNGTLFSISGNSNASKLLEINSLSGGAFQIRAKDTSGNWQTRTTSTTAFPTNVWRCLVANFDSYSGNKGSTYRIKGFCNAYNGGGGRWEAVDDGSSSDTLSTVAWDTETSPYGIGCIPASGSSGTNIFDGDIALVAIMKGVGSSYGTATDSKLDGWIDNTHEKMGL